MNIFIPEIGTQIKLTEAWIFLLYKEYRNSNILTALGDNVSNLKKIETVHTSKFGHKWSETYYEMFLPVDTILTVNRVYIRNGQTDYSSVTFSINDTTHPFLLYDKQKKKKKTCGRFWAKLCDVNNIKCEIVKDTTKIFGDIQK